MKWQIIFVLLIVSLVRGQDEGEVETEPETEPEVNSEVDVLASPASSDSLDSPPSPPSPPPIHSRYSISPPSLDYKPTKTEESLAPGTNYGPAIFQEEFNELNHDIWKHELTLGGGGNWEFQYYNNNRSTSFVKDGQLYLKPVLTTEVLGISDEELIKNGALNIWGNSPGFQCTANGFYGCDRRSDGNNIINPVMSAQLRTHESFSFKYGKVEVRAKLPRGDWLWPAIWFLPKHYSYGGWPASGEIDLLESRGNSPEYHGHGIDTVASTLHWGPDWQHNQYNRTTAMYKLPKGQTFADDFHTFTLEWTPQLIRTWVDNKNLVLDLDLTKRSFFDQAETPNLFNPWKHASNHAPFDHSFYIVLNLAVGGTNTYFPDEPHTKSYFNATYRHSTPKPWKNSSPTAAKDFLLNKSQWYPTWTQRANNMEPSSFIIDYIRVYPLNSN